MKYYSLFEKADDRTALGYGIAGARWNLQGTPMIYASNCSAITFMELLSIKGPIVAGTKWILATFEVNSEIAQLNASDLPTGWYVRPYPRSTQEFGTRWAQKVTPPFLKVPSCRIPLTNYPAEHNLLINPLHPDTNKHLRVISEVEVSFELNDW